MMIFVVVILMWKKEERCFGIYYVNGLGYVYSEGIGYVQKTICRGGSTFFFVIVCLEAKRSERTLWSVETKADDF